MKKSRLLTLAAILTMTFLLASVNLSSHAQDPLPLRVEAATTGELTTAAPTVVYTFDAVESLRMGFVYDVQGDMEVTMVILGSDQQTVLAGSSGPNNNGVIVTFPSEGTYYVGLSASNGNSATYRLMIDADPPLPVNAFILQSYMAEGASTVCAENTPTTVFAPDADMNVCFTAALIDQPVDLQIQWWSPSGQIVVEEGGQFTSDDNNVTYLTGVVYPDTPFETGWWQVHFLLNGELSHIQWVPVQ